MHMTSSSPRCSTHAALQFQGKTEEEFEILEAEKKYIDKNKENPQL